MSFRTFRATSVLSGTIIGAGVFALPYVFQELGFLISALYLIVFSLVHVALHHMYAELLTATPREHHYLYLAERYLPNWFARVMSFVVFGGLIFALTIYLTLSPTFLRLIFGATDLLHAALFWLAGSMLMFLGLRGQGWVQVACVIGIIFITLVVFFVGLVYGSGAPLLGSPRAVSFLIPFGALLFSFGGRVAIPEMVAVWRQGRKRFSLSHALSLGTLFPALVYALFVFGIVRLVPTVQPDALSGLSLNPGLMMLLGAFGLAAIVTSYFMIGENIQDILRVDLRLPRAVSDFLPVIVPLALYLAGFRDFVGLVSFAGGVFGGLIGFSVVLMWWRAFPHHEYRWVGIPLYIVFGVAIVYAVWSTLPSFNG
jgi:tyrosine-specific transport protein